MSGCFKSRRAVAASVLTLGLALAAVQADEAAAKAKAQKFHFMQEPVFSTVIPQPSRMPIRFFTINQVLARADGHAGPNGSELRLAALQFGDSRSDAPALSKPDPTSVRECGRVRYARRRPGPS